MSTTLGAIAQALAFLGTVAALVLSFSAAILLVLFRQSTWARRVAAGGVALGLTYVAALVAVGAASGTQTLDPGATKAFCEMDCHVVYSVVSAKLSANGRLAVTVRELFDPESISSRRGDGLLTPGGRYFALVDDRGHRHVPMSVRMLDAAPLFASLRPGEMHRATLEFSLPPGARAIGLLVESDDPVSMLLIGHERSPFHGKVLLPVGTATAGIVRE